MNQKIDARARLIDRIDYPPRYIELEFEMIEPIEMDFLPGQYISIHIEQYVRRSYSVLTSPEESKKRFKVLLDLTPQGKGTLYLQNLQVGEEISFIGQIGRFTFQEDIAENLIFIATGSGISPINSMIDSLVLSQRYLNHKIVLYYGTSYLKDLIYDDKFNYYKYSNLITDYKVGISRDTKIPALPFLFNKRVTDLLDELNSTIKNNTQVFICGNSDMIDAASGKLIFKGFRPAQIFHEKFY